MILLSLIDEKIINLELYKHSDLQLISLAEIVQEIATSDELNILNYLTVEHKVGIGDTLDICGKFIID